MTLLPNGAGSYLSTDKANNNAKVVVNAMEPAKQQQPMESDLTMPKRVEQRQPVASAADGTSTVRSDAAVPNKAIEQTRPELGGNPPPAAPPQKPPMHPPPVSTPKDGNPKMVKIESGQEPVVAKTVGRFKVLAKTANIVPAGEAPPTALQAPAATDSTVPALVVPTLAVRSTSAGSSPDGSAALSAPAERAPQQVVSTPKGPMAATGASPGSSASSTAASPAPSPPPSVRKPPVVQPLVAKKKGRFVVLPAAIGTPISQPGTPTLQPTTTPEQATNTHMIQQQPPQQPPPTTATTTATTPVTTQHKTTNQQRAGSVEKLPATPQPAEARAVGESTDSSAAARPAADKQRQRGSSLTRVPASFDSKGLASQQGLGKVYYFLDQMKLEVVDADKTIKNLQNELKTFKEKNKELEARGREMERRWKEEKTAREAAETKVRTWKKKVRELKESAAASPVVEGTDSGPHSRANSLDSVDDVLEKKANPAAVTNDGSPKKTSPNSGAASKLTTISSGDTGSLAEKQEMMDLRIDLGSKIANSGDVSSKAVEKPEVTDATKNQSSPVKKVGTESAVSISHRRTESLGMMDSEAFSRDRRRVSSESNIDVFFNMNGSSAPASPTPATAPATPQQQQPARQTNGSCTQSFDSRAMANMHRRNESSDGGVTSAMQQANAFDPLGTTPRPESTLQKTSSMQNVMTGSVGAMNNVDPLGNTPRPENMMQQTTAATNMMTGAVSMNNMANAMANTPMGGQQGMMQQPQQPMMNVPQQTMSMTQVQMQGGVPPQQMQGVIPPQQLNHSTSWSQNPMQHPQANLVRHQSTGHMSQFHQQQQAPQQQMMSIQQQPQQPQQPQMASIQPPQQQMQQQPQMTPMMNGSLAPAQQQQQQVPQHMATMMNGSHLAPQQQQQQFHPEMLQQPILGGQQPQTFQQQQQLPMNTTGSTTQEADAFTQFVSERK